MNLFLDRSNHMKVTRRLPESWTDLEFEQAYEESVREVLTHWTHQMQLEISTHCVGWHPDRYNLSRYLEASCARYLRAYTSLRNLANGTSVCDIGGFWGVFPLTLRRLGYAVTMTESLKFYSQSFYKLFDFIGNKGVHIIDVDLFERQPDLIGTFDFVTLMAVLEHYPHSPKPIMENLHAMLHPGGCAHIEVPNIAYWPKRMALLRGKTPLVPITDIMRSKAPFIGHHHEYTINELRELVALHNLRIVKEEFYNYSIELSLVQQLIQYPLQTIAFWLWPNTRECLAVACARG